ncbi:MAG: hypothetical protein EXS68_01325 [Candidatus Ryanbacteria bacterium]|nr:hypothetical protein [Candidatus Ryanbacteria bacterium]
MFSSDKNQKRVISDIRPAGGTRKTPMLVQKKHAPEPLPPRHQPPEHAIGDKKPLRFGFRQAMIIAGAVVVVGASIWWSSTLTLVIKKQERKFNMGEGIPLMVAAKEFKTEIVERGEGASTNVEAFSRRASGTVIVYNNYSSEPQVLVKNTRFQTPKGLIFRAAARVVVPGKKSDKPGSVEVEITADEPGEKYNVGRSDFKIPGFASTPKYDKFYARSRADALGDIKGGAAGQGKVVGKAEAEALIKSLEEKVKANLAAKLASEIKDPYIIFSDTIEATVTLRVTDPPAGAPGDKFFGEVRGEAKVLAVDRAAYQSALANILFEDKALIASFTLPASTKLACEKPKLDYAKSSISCTVQGEMMFEGVVPVDVLRGKVLATRKVADLEAVFKLYPGIKKVEQTYRPAFLKRIPSRPGQLIIQVR